MMTGYIRSDMDRVFVSDGDGLDSVNDGREKATKIKVLNCIVSMRFCFGMIEVSSYKHFFDVQLETVANG